MPISTRTPEGEPLHCPICGAVMAMEVSDPAGDALCPACGHLLWEFRDAISRLYGVPASDITLSASLNDFFGQDSLGSIEFVMELEGRGFVIDVDDYEKIRTVRDLVEYLRRRKSES